MASVTLPFQPELQADVRNVPPNFAKEVAVSLAVIRASATPPANLSPYFSPSYSAALAIFRRLTSALTTASASRPTLRNLPEPQVHSQGRPRTYTPGTLVTPRRFVG